MIYVARREFGMSARELFAATPEWEVDVLFAERDREIKEAEKEARRQR